MVNESITLNCTLTVEEGAMVFMSWDYPNKNSSRIEVKKPVRQNKTFGQERFILSVVTSQLTVRDMQWSDEGWYTCSCRDHGGKTNNDSVFIHVKAKPVVTVVNDTELFASGANFTLVCTVEGSNFLSAWWEWRECVEPRACFEQSLNSGFKVLGEHTPHVNGPGDGTPLVQTAGRKPHVNVTLRLRAQQSGLYRCIGSNLVGMSFSVVKFYVTDVKNGFEIITSDVTPVDQDKVRLSCLANQFKYGNLTWRWKAEGSPDYFSLNASDALQINMSSTAFSNNLTLYFNPIGRNQSGLYECIAVTRGENTHRHIEFVNIAVRDMRPPEFSANTTLRNNVVSAVPYLLLYCSANGVPEPTISWFKDGKPLNMTGPSLTKVKVTPQDSAFYQCRAENRAGATYANITINAASGRTLGQGAFGRVVKAEAIGLGPNGQSLAVAVKMLKEGADMPQRMALMAELKILIHLGRHLNIVNILGAVTKNLAKGELMVIVEYCKFGNLRHYLLRHRERFINQLNPETGRVDPDICYSPKSPTSPSPGFRSACAAFVIS
ncbi:hypothetical protein V5799_003128 [Amblyomma americanum]|uniref:receptor protein-tyrosine kinase n=1 Tax=Amblyomma americanum TaxID=6943 RepID=A0AAQ4D9V2_AMBAM